MSRSSAFKVAVLVLAVAVIMGALGFATGFATHTILASEPSAADSTAPTIVAEITDTPEPEEAIPSPIPATEAPASSPTEAAPETTPVPSIEIPAATGESFDLFWEVWDLVQRDFYGDLPTDDEMTYGAIRGALNTLDDPYTGFIEPQTAAINRENDSGSFEGIGAFVNMENGWLIIVNPMSGQPAEKAGLRRGDIVIQVDDTPIENMSLYEAITLIRGPAGTPVRLTILREGEEPFEVEIVRASIEIPLVEAEMRDDGIAYVSLYQFKSDASAKLGEAIEELLAQNPSGLVLDLRGNPGGWLSEAISTSGLFLPKGELVLIERLKDGTEQPYTVPNDPLLPDLPVVVLVDGGSASSSEIVAGALQDHGRATLIGERTFGKGSVQLAYELSNGAELRVTKARWFTPNDRPIHGEGLEPDIVVELTAEDLENDLDPQLDRAIEYLLTGQ